MKRFDPDIDSSECFQGMAESLHGEYVEYDAVKEDIGYFLLVGGQHYDYVEDEIITARPTIVECKQDLEDFQPEDMDEDADSYCPFYYERFKLLWVRGKEKKELQRFDKNKNPC